MAAEGNELFWLGPSEGPGAMYRDAVLQDGRKLAFWVLTRGYGDGHSHAFNSAVSYIKDIRPDVFYVLLDAFMLHPNHNFIHPEIQAVVQSSIPVPSTIWFPSDGGFFPHHCDSVLRKFTRPVAMSRWGQNQVLKQFGLKTDYIPHGVKSNLFYPLSAEEKFQLRNVYGRRMGRDLVNKFVVGCVARNQPRKAMDRLIKGFALFAKGRPDVILLMHSDPNDPAQFFPIKELISRFKVGHKVEWTGMNANTGFPDAQMNEIYNLFDVKADSTTGEGFGITIVESMACEVPVVITDYTTTKELVTDNGAGLGVRLLGEDAELYNDLAEGKITNQVVGSWGVERGFCDVYHLAEQLGKCYDDWKKGGAWLKEMGRNGRKAFLKDYEFDTRVWPSWRRLFKELMM